MSKYQDHVEQRLDIMANGIVPRLEVGQVAVLIIADNLQERVTYISNGERESCKELMQEMLHKWRKDAMTKPRL